MHPLKGDQPFRIERPSGQGPFAGAQLSILPPQAHAASMPPRPPESSRTASTFFVYKNSGPGRGAAVKPGTKTLDNPAVAATIRSDKTVSVSMNWYFLGNNGA